MRWVPACPAVFGLLRPLCGEREQDPPPRVRKLFSCGARIHGYGQESLEHADRRRWSLCDAGDGFPISIPPSTARRLRLPASVCRIRRNGLYRRKYRHRAQSGVRHRRSTRVLRKDNGPELVSRALQWFSTAKWVVPYSRSRHPGQRLFVSFSSRIRRECLNRNHWNSLFGSPGGRRRLQTRA